MKMAISITNISISIKNIHSLPGNGIIFHSSYFLHAGFQLLYIKLVVI